MNLRTRIAAGATAAAMVSIFGLAGTAASAAPSVPPSTIAAAEPAADLPVTGLLPDGSKFTGQLSELVASVVNGVPTLSGLLKGNGLPAAGVPFKSAIGSVTAACKILNLNIQPINLDLLGLVVNTDTIHATIDAVPGGGNLLGNLLCGLAGALAPGAVPVPLIAPILSEVISVLRLGPVAPAPVAPAPVAPAPAPVAPAPVAPAPVAPAPVVPAPVMPAPVMPAPGMPLG
jgi:hypothetical protein